jgi:hypothetical protein
MTRIVLDSNTLAKLHNFAELAEICDEQGHVLGFACPVSTSYRGIHVPLTDEEVAELRKQPRGRPLRDILAKLERAK